MYATESLPSGRSTETGKFITIRVAGVWFASGMERRCGIRSRSTVRLCAGSLWL